jgi:hypothetical protein
MSDDESHNQTFEQVNTRRSPSPISDFPPVMTIDIRLMLERLLLTLCNALPCVKTVTSSLKVNKSLAVLLPDIPTLTYFVGRPCKIVEMSTSKTGKHGHAKVHLVAIDVSRKFLLGHYSFYFSSHERSN